MAQNALQRQDVAAIYHEMTGERVAQYVSELPLRQRDVGTLDSLFECSRATREHRAQIPVFRVVLAYLVLHAYSDWNTSSEDLI